MEKEKRDLLTIYDNIIKAFRPIEQLFKIMDSSSAEIYGELSRLSAEVGLSLCEAFRIKLDDILHKQTGGEKHE